MQVSRLRHSSARQSAVRGAPARAVKDVFMPALSSTMTEGRVVSWLKAEGDAISKGEPIVVVESDKADMEVESFEDGFLGAIVIGEGETASVGTPIGFIAESEGEIGDAKSKGDSNGAAAPAKPASAEEEQKVEAPAAHAVTDDAAAAPAAPGPAPAAPEPVAPPPAPGPAPRADGRVIATPYAKMLAKKHKVDLSKIGGTGPNGRITADDVTRAAGGGTPGASSASSAPVPAGSPPPAPESAPAVVAAAEAAGTTVAELRGTTVPFTSMEKSVAKNMQASLAVAPFRATAAICTDALDALYRELKPRGVTMSALLAKACGVALASHPRMFASCTPDGAGITYNEHINIANAVAMPDGGLITPVLKDCDSTDIYQMSRQWKDLVKRARGKALAPDEYSTGTFTISNLGMMGVETFDAILPPGTAAIIAIGASVPTVVANDAGMIGVKKIMKVNITADHRIVYGAHGAEFLQTLKGVIEQPDVLLK